MSEPLHIPSDERVHYETETQYNARIGKYFAIENFHNAQALIYKKSKKEILGIMCDCLKVTSQGIHNKDRIQPTDDITTTSDIAYCANYNGGFINDGEIIVKVYLIASKGYKQITTYRYYCFIKALEYSCIVWQSEIVNGVTNQQINLIVKQAQEERIIAEQTELVKSNIKQVQIGENKFVNIEADKQQLYQRGNTTLYRLRKSPVTLQRYTTLVECINDWKKLVDNNVPQAWLDYISEHPYVHEGV